MKTQTLFLAALVLALGLTTISASASERKTKEESVENTSISFQLIDSENEEYIELEEWMIDESEWEVLNNELNEDAKEYVEIEKMSIESWMTDNKLWSFKETKHAHKRFI